MKTIDENANEFVILIDGGTVSTFDHFLKKELEKLEVLDLIVLTHIDSDHIGGLLKFFKSRLIKEKQVKRIMVNHPDLIGVNQNAEISYSQADNLVKLISEKLPDTEIISDIKSESKILKFNGIELEIISPTKDIVNNLYNNWKTKINTCKTQEISSLEMKEDIAKSLLELSKESFKPQKTINEDIVNASSISFIMRCLDTTVLFLADSRAEIIYDALSNKGYTEDAPLVIDYVKISHHGSKNNTSIQLLNILKSSNYIISTNGGSGKSSHPSRETIARIVHSKNRNEDKLRIILN